MIWKLRHRSKFYECNAHMYKHSVYICSSVLALACVPQPPHPISIKGWALLFSFFNSSQINFYMSICGLKVLLVPIMIIPVHTGPEVIP